MEKVQVGLGSRRRASVARPRPRGGAAKLTQAERTALSDSRMLDAAIKLVGERGTHNTTLKEIGELAGYSRGLASSRFGSKEALFEELLSQFNRRWKLESISAAGDRRGLEAWKVVNQTLIDFFEHEAEFIRALYLIWYETIGSSDILRKRLADQHAAYRRDLARWVREGIEDGVVAPHINPDTVALQYAAGVFGLIYQWLIHPEAFDISRAIHDFGVAAIGMVTTRQSPQ